MFLGADPLDSEIMAPILQDLKIDINKSIGVNFNCFIIAEIGQNHQGNIEIAKELIIEAKTSGADCVKFQKTCISEKFNQAALDKKYDSPNSWGSTYGEHKKFLEFSDTDFVSLQTFAREHDILFSSSAMDMSSIDFLVDIGVPFLKIGSGDSNNLPMIEYAASKQIPLIISTGMIGKDDVVNIYNTVKKYHSKFALMHCVSSYPTPYEDCNLNVIKDYQESFPDIHIGYSGHELGSSVTVAAVALGAKIIERHFTLDKTQKGSDHSCSLLPSELKELINQIHIVKSALGEPSKKIVASEKNCIDKLQKSLTTAIPLKKGHVVQRNDLNVKVTEPKGMNSSKYETVIGMTLGCDKLRDEPIFETDFIVV